MKYNVAIRTDASPEIGMGHIMRCVAVAEALQRAGMVVRFIINNESSCSVLEERGFPYTVIPSFHINMDEEIPTLRTLLSSGEYQAILVDSYKAGDGYLMELEHLVPVVFIDGLYKCDVPISVVLNYNAAASYDVYQKKFLGRKTELLIGCDFVPLRKEFLRKKEGRTPEGKLNILLTTGATDLLNVIPELCERWNNSEEIKNCIVHIVIGRLFQNINKIETMAVNCPWIVLHKNVKDMSALMEKTDIAVSAAGTTVFELLSMGIPIVSYAIADIQNTFSAFGDTLLWIGDIRQKDDRGIKGSERITLALEKLVVNPDLRNELSKKACSMIDSKGGERIAAEVQKIIGQRLEGRSW